MQITISNKEVIKSNRNEQKDVLDTIQSEDYELAVKVITEIITDLNIKNQKDIKINANGNRVLISARNPENDFDDSYYGKCEVHNEIEIVVDALKEFNIESLVEEIKERL